MASSLERKRGTSSQIMPLITCMSTFTTIGLPRILQFMGCRDHLCRVIGGAKPRQKEAECEAHWDEKWNDGHSNIKRDYYEHTIAYLIGGRKDYSTKRRRRSRQKSLGVLGRKRSGSRIGIVNEWVIV